MRSEGGDPNELMYVGMQTIPMGWCGAVGVIHAAVRTLVFDFAQVPRAIEVTKQSSFPECASLSFGLLGWLRIPAQIEHSIAECR